MPGKDVVWIAAAAALLLATGCSSTKPKDAAIAPAVAAAVKDVMLSGAEEVPANPSAARGNSTIAVGTDYVVTGAIVVTGMVPTMAHIHEAARGANGPVIVPLVKTGENTFAPAPGARITPLQYRSYKAGGLYVNVHSATYPGGEIRRQIWPAGDADSSGVSWSHMHELRNNR